MQQHNLDLYGDLKAAGNAGTNGQFLQSQGPNVTPIWTNGSLGPLYYYTDKTTQVIAVGPADVTWNAAASDASNGITFNGTTLFTLAANRLYKLTANITPTVATVEYSISWVDTSNVAIGSLNQPANGLANLSHVHAFALFKPLVNTQVKVRLTSAVALTLGPVCSVFIETVD